MDSNYISYGYSFSSVKNPLLTINVTDPFIPVLRVPLLTCPCVRLARIGQKPIIVQYYMKRLHKGFSSSLKDFSFLDILTKAIWMWVTLYKTIATAFQIGSENFCPFIIRFPSLKILKIYLFFHFEFYKMSFFIL